MVAKITHPLVTVQISNEGVEQISLDAQSESQEFESLKLYAVIRTAIQLIDGMIKRSQGKEIA